MNKYVYVPEVRCNYCDSKLWCICDITKYVSEAYLKKFIQECLRDLCDPQQKYDCKEKKKHKD